MAPQKLTLEDGSEVEVPTKEEQDVLQAKADAHDELQTKVTELEKFKEDSDADPSNKNWKEMRDNNKRLKDALKASGKDVDDEGNITEKPNTLTAEEVDERAIKAAKGELLSNHRSTLLNKITDEEQRKVVEHYFGKLSAGEELDFNGVEKYMQEAQRLATPAGEDSNRINVNGGAPKLVNANGGNNFSETEDGKRMAAEMFGDDSFTNAKEGDNK